MTHRSPHRPLGLLAALMLVSGAARGADTEVALVGEAQLGWTDNAQSSPDAPVPGVPEKKADAFAVLSPGLGLTRGTRGALQRLGVTTSVTLHWHERDADTWSSRAEYQGLFDLDPRTWILVGTSASTTRAWTATIVTPAGAGELSGTLQGTGTTLTLGADETLSHDLTRSLRGWQGARFAHGRSLDDSAQPYSTGTQASFGLERSFRLDAFGLELRGEYGTVSSSAARPSARQLTSTAVVIHRHDLGRYLTSRLEAGAMRVDRPSSGRYFWHPSALAALAHTGDWGGAALSYSHRATTSVTLGQTLLVDEVLLSGAVPLLGERTLVVAGSAGYQRGRVIEEDASRGARLEIALADLALAWQLAPSAALGLRYQHTRQLSDGTAPPDPLSFRRNSVLAGVSLRFPPETELRRPLRQPLRVDRADDVRGRRSSDQERRVD